MLKIFSEAFSLFWRYLGLFTAIILTVWLPGNILINFITYNVDGVSEIGVMRLTILIEVIFGPVYIGALVYTLAQIKMGKAISYKEAMAVGFRKWIALFGALFVAGIIVGLGFIALIIPGIVLAVRYAFIAPAVILENKVTSESRARSAALTIGRRWEIFGAAILFFIPFFIFSILIYLPLGFIESLNLMPVEIALDCVLDVVYAIVQIVMFLYYWDAVKEQDLTNIQISQEDQALYT